MVAAVTDAEVRRPPAPADRSVDQWSDSTDLKAPSSAPTYAGSTAAAGAPAPARRGPLQRAISSGVSPAGVRSLAASASASAGGGKCGFGTATRSAPAAAADRSPLAESSTATQRRVDAELLGRGEVDVRGRLPRATSSLDTATRNRSATPAAASTTWIRSGGEELATASGQRPDSAVTAPTAPGSSGTCAR